jgi:hypothetical protein
VSRLALTFAFRKMCHDATDALYEQYSTQSVAVDMIEHGASGENRHVETDDFSASSDHLRMINNEEKRPLKITVPNERQTSTHDLSVESSTVPNISKCFRKMSSNVAGGSNKKKELSRKFDCKRCEKSYQTKKGLLEHNKNVHENRKFSCKICLTIFTNNGTLYHHIQYSEIIRTSLVPVVKRYSQAITVYANIFNQFIKKSGMNVVNANIHFHNEALLINTSKPITQISSPTTLVIYVQKCASVAHQSKST